MTLSIRLVYSFLLTLFLYIYVFQPPVIPKEVYFIAWSSLFLLFAILKFKYVQRFFSTFKVELLFGLVICIWAVARDLVSGEMVYADRFLAWFVSSMLVPIVVISTFFKLRDKSSLKPITLDGWLYRVAIVAGLITVLLILVPPFDKLYESIQLDVYYENYENFDFRYRAYGISENLTFTYGYILGVFAGYSILKMRENKFNFLIFFLLIVGVAFNARIGFLPAVATAFFSILFRAPLKGMLIILLVCFIVPIFISERELQSMLSAFSWAASFFVELYDYFIEGEVNNTVGTIFSDFVIVPETVKSQIFGKGISLFGVEGDSTDSGYFLQLNYAGIFFVLLLCSFLILCSLRIFMKLGVSSWYPYLFCFSVFFLNLKGFLFAATPGSRLLFLLYIYYVLESTKKSRLQGKLL